MDMPKRKLLNTALEHLELGAWQAAHEIVQNDESQMACWAHGIVHIMEGDLDNARYWYGRAGRAFSGDAAQELSALRKSLKPD